MRTLIDASLVRRLISDQCPQWGGLPISAVEPGGWDNRTFRLGETMSVRLPSGQAYAAQVKKEQHWLPRLAPLLPLPIPVPLVLGHPADGFPWPWSVYRWIEGETASDSRIDDLDELATTLARFLVALQRIDPADGPAPGTHNFHRVGPLSIYDGETRDAIAALHGAIDVAAATRTWDAALAATWPDAPTWLHGDVSASNLLVDEGRLVAVIDFGCSGTGDAACDLAIAWTLFSGESREAFRAMLPFDGAAWAHGRGWALWKGLITLAEKRHTDPREAERARRVIDQVIADHQDAI